MSDSWKVPFDAELKPKMGIWHSNERLDVRVKEMKLVKLAVLKEELLHPWMDAMDPNGVRFCYP